MTPKEAVIAARGYVEGLFAAEGAKNFGLEELRFDGNDQVWSITIGFTRPWEGPQGISRYGRIDQSDWPRTFKTVEIDDQTGRVLSLKHWPVAA